ncbi:hypothetical protein JX265_006501 [Neoarthrinium moseri]|uniref:Microbial-type PARG catalytic domain-containing protein n=1 Tax=Neoarthrinium moseri TaxID=1658444 RepID=A0A9P9WL66_9PEZI|nr:hypothetical protein JX265_006501 [Neoarthrinium moseri]
MGRTEPSQGLAPPSFRRDARAKKAKATINKVIPGLLSAHPRAKRGAEASELMLEPLARKKDKETVADKEAFTATQMQHGPRITLRVADTLTAARSLLQKESTGKLDLSNKNAKVAILNMASPLSPGGGFVNGASSQEESLCMRTTLLSSLKDEFYRLPELGAIYTPDVLVFRDEEGADLEKRDRWFVDCVSAAMLRMPETEVDEDSGRGRYASDKDRDLILQKMRTVMRIFQAKGAKSVVLGAWGCGAYGNPVGEVAAAWRKVLLGGRNKGKGNKENWNGIQEVVFAIKDASLADGFEGAFGSGLTRQESQDDLEEDHGNDDLEAQRMKELQDKIQELELRAEQARTPQLKSGLDVVLTGLRRELGEQRASSEQGPISLAGDEEGLDSSDNQSEESDDEDDSDSA